MTKQIVLKPESFLDPRGKPKDRPPELADRLASLKGKQILLLDNGQLTVEYRLYGMVFDILEEFLKQKHGVKACPRMRDELLQGGKERMKDVAASILKRKADGVVLALSHAGVTQPSVILASHLERAGLPVVMICTGLGGPLAAVTAQSYVPGLPLISIRPSVEDTKEVVREKTEQILKEIIDGLTLSKAELNKRFQSRMPAGKGALKATRRGELELKAEAIVAATEDSKGRPTGAVDPSRFTEELYEELCASDMCDGFPVIAPTRERVDRMLRFTDRSPQHALVDECPPSGASITIEKLAINAVMAGCKPEYFPIVVTAFEAMAEPRYRLFQGCITTHPSGNAVVVSGPLAKELGIQSGPGCLGPGFRANATIGRALTLCMFNICRAIPARSDLSVFGSPAEYSYCFAESDEDNPWLPFHTELCDAETTTVTVHKAEGPQNVINALGANPEGLVASIASQAATLAGNNYCWPCELIVILNPTHARVFAQAGWSKEDIKLALFDQARNPVEPIKGGRGIPPAWPAWFRSSEWVPVVHVPDEVLIFVAGGMGPHSMVCKPWGLARLVTKPVTFKDGRPVRSVADFNPSRSKGRR
ncbi:MAG: hypothetical protein ABIH46_06395 [Chloroflexota bacterium]